MRGIREIERELESLELNTTYSVFSNKRVNALLTILRKENFEKVVSLKKELEDLKCARIKTKKPRWPDNTPQHILDFCKEHWRGTEESASYRIHCWNDKWVWTSYPAGGYSIVGGWVKTQATFFLLSLTEMDDYERRHKLLKMLEGRASEKMMRDELAKL